jgi:hypothetical protein
MQRLALGKTIKRTLGKTRKAGSAGESRRTLNARIAQKTFLVKKIFNIIFSRNKEGKP